MKLKVVGWIIAMVAALGPSLSKAYDYPSCLMEPLVQQATPSIVISQAFQNSDIQTCMENHLNKNLATDEVSNIRVGYESKNRTLEMIENWQANLAVVQEERINASLDALYGVAVALGERTDEVLKPLRSGVDWAEVGRLTANMASDDMVVGYLQGNPKYWSMLGSLKPNAIAGLGDLRIANKSSQHFHLIRIQCDLK